MPTKSLYDPADSRTVDALPEDRVAASLGEPATRSARALTIEAAVTAEVEAQLRSGVLRPGDRINESALAAQLGSSRGPVREALRALEHSGLVRSELNRGIIVLELSAKEALEIYDLRAALFALACKTACGTASSAWVRDLSALVDQMDNAVEIDDIDAYYPLNVEFHDRIIERANNSLQQDFWTQLERRLHLSRRLGLISPGAMRLSNSQHRRIVEAFSRGDMAALGALAEQHMLESKARFLNNIAASVERV